MNTLTRFGQYDLRLEPFGDADIPALVAAIPDERFLLQWGGPVYVFPLDERQLLTTLATARAELPVHFLFKVVCTVEGSTVGHVELMRVDRSRRTAALGRVLLIDRDLYGRGMGRGVVARALDFAFGTLDCEDVTLNVFDFNHSAISCYRALGFETTEVRPNARNFHGEPWTLIAMRLSRKRWLAVDQSNTQKDFIAIRN